jgi:membrane protein implicated in regulation of membrane protease activity
VPGWLRTSLLIAAIVVGALLLWVGLALLVAALVIVALPFWLWSLFVRRRAPAGSITIEGSARRVDDTAPLSPRIEEEKGPRAGSREP